MEDHSDSDGNNPGLAIEAFLSAFGKMDIYSQIVMEEFMEVLLEKEE